MTRAYLKGYISAMHKRAQVGPLTDDELRRRRRNVRMALGAVLGVVPGAMLGQNVASAIDNDNPEGRGAAAGLAGRILGGLAGAGLGAAGGAIVNNVQQYGGFDPHVRPTQLTAREKEIRTWPDKPTSLFGPAKSKLMPLANY